MSRLADYFVIVGYDHEKDRSGISCGKILQRFPQTDWDDAPFIDGIELFCQPQGWSLSTVHQEPKYFVSVLTDIEANRHYCACLSFSETEAIMPTKQTDDDDLIDETNGSTSAMVTHTHHSIMYAPKCLLLVSQLSYFETFRNCLGIVYTVYIESMPIPLETLIGNILGCVQVPPPGGPQVRFSIGAGDRQALQPPLSNALPVTHSTVFTLFHQLGIHNVLSLFCAALTEQKIVFHSCSYSRLTDSCHALVALLFPFKYSHVYIPLLPTTLIEFLSTPTPFIMGIRSSLRNELAELMDVIVVDLDGGSIFIPECINLAMLPEPFYSSTHKALSSVLHPELMIADNAFFPSQTPSFHSVMLDKEIRAIFLQLFAQLLQGYRSCLTIIRIHPKPFISFHKAAFLGQRNMVEDPFMARVLECMFFNSFVAERGPPYRVCDIFDELYAGLQDGVQMQNAATDGQFHNVHELAQQLYQNEIPNPQPYVQKIPKPTEGASTRIHLPPFPTIDHGLVQDIIAEGLATNSIKSRLHSLRPQQPRMVPLGPPVSSLQDQRLSVSNSARRLEVLRSCINCIFENKISDARKTFPAVLRALKTKVARLALCHELSHHVIGNKAMLEHQQFDLVVRLMNCALQDDSSMDEHGVAAALLPLSTAFCRKLCTGVIQFAYTCIQEHAVWSNHQFWEATYYQDVQKDIKALYFPRQDGHHSAGMSRDPSLSPISPRDSKEFSIFWNKERWSLGSDQYLARRTAGFIRPQEPSALEIAAEQMRTWSSLPIEKQTELILSEESTVYSQAIHFANRIVYLRVPLDTSGHITRSISLEGESNSNSNMTNSLAESDSLDAESGFEEDTSEVGASVIRFVSRFVDKVCTESGVTEEHMKALHQMIPGVVAMHIETLEGVSRESKRLPPIQKPKILGPSLLPGEELILEGLRVYLIPDGREEGIGGQLGGPALLPAEGAIFLTNYRIIFKGTPCDSFANDQIVIRYFPVSSLTKEKRISGQLLTHLDQCLQEGLQLRSNTFQLLKVGFDEEVTSESIETLRKLIHRVRNPPTIFNLFAFASQMVAPLVPLQKQKEKNATLRQFAKKTLLKTAVKAGIKSKPSSRKQKYTFFPPHAKSMTTPAGRTITSLHGLPPEPSPFDRPSSMYDDDVSTEPKVGDESDLLQSIPVIVLQTDSKTLEKLTETSYYRDYQRLGFGSMSNCSNLKAKMESFRITTINSSYALCRSYPALLVVPQSVSDDSLRKLCRCHRQNRFPVVTWRHPRTKALLLRGSSFHGKGVMGMLKSHQTPSGNISETSATVEQEKFIASVVNCTPMHNIRQGAWTSMNGSSLSINSLVMAAAGSRGEGYSTLTPECSRRTSSPFTKAMNTLRSSGGRTTKQFTHRGSLKDRGSITSIGIDSGFRSTARMSDADSGMDNTIQSFHKAALYVFGEKAQIKGIRQDSYSKCDFIPMDFHEVRHIKASFKKLMRACVASSVPLDGQRCFYKAIESSEWMTQLQTILQLSGAAVDLIDVQGSSVMVCLEDGWDITTQIVSVAELCLDPYYRTIAGFRTLIEKEWLGFGHRFTHRGNQTATTQANGFAPLFLQFLDIVHQIHNQFPLSFEFNLYFLKFLAYHYVSCRFRTFMLDSEFERMEAGWLLEERAGKCRNLDSGSDDESGFSKMGQSIWDYLDRYAHRYPMFFNFYYYPDQDNLVLRPYSNISNLKIWDYYLKEDLAYGPSYELEGSVAIREDLDLLDSSTNRRVVNSCYDNVPNIIPDAYSYLMEEIHRLESELGHLPQKWKVLWDKLEVPNSDSLTRQGSYTTQMIRSHGRSFHKRSTIEILVKGKMVGESAQVYSHPHRFERYNYTTFTNCDYCSNVLWGFVRTGMRCVDCGYNCHEKCMESVPKNCTRYKSVSDAGPDGSTLTKANSDVASVTSSNSKVNSNGSPRSDNDISLNLSLGVGAVQSTSQYYDQFSSNVAENRTHEGYLYKRGALLKGWKQRWFVLDSIKHQMRYYDAMEDSHCKGFIDLSEVMYVTSGTATQGAPKRSDDKAFFDLRTSKRMYNFLASDATSGQEWVEKIQACLQ